VWAVGATGGLAASAARPTRAAAGPASEPLILHWNGTAWVPVPIRRPANGAQLIGVHVASGRNAWAVGCTKTFANRKARPLVLHWNGTAWQ
jgi:hypothetical protein